jgi:hypothetical protein
MNQKKYDFWVSNRFRDYEFYSEGLKGRIKKVVRFRPITSDGITFFNLAFDDWNEITGQIDDRIITNNGDRDKVLATVAATVLEFTDRYPGTFVYAKGSTPGRTRLYQIGIACNWEEIHRHVHVYGVTKENYLELFQKSINYEAFIILRKKA